MDEAIQFFVGLDVHKATIAVAIAESGRAPARLIGSIGHEVGKLIKLLARYGEPGAVQGGCTRRGPRAMACSARWRGGAIRPR